mmetsp:Transcript_19942/g.29577  ORF Transcript_19942/g.29577 Transcript_19942/m.29577 type:complete len:418 (-) Transcript_19942:160-1413(-)|eukprot:CAMPEP_0194200116 /NCGR_PEP_ID=MMETSP0156-20130528/865_1 /TAXON_ID=33649 /ORGANISM="Thalassionema nitzschioides, Strain L26-B" /LENGTH=417 /DNA_ID=CAMNT_0038925083 /DNA_START=128 /DNA_END=1381 /DNA_ORIENTATION=-
MTTTGKENVKQGNEAVPIFLRKTYHMIDTCDANVACWSDDGETFIVKNTDVFEKSIIPQFFKHSKFSSFVRQLNFYGFRKIKYADTIKIDAKLEAETANFWRFRHEKFIRGKPELLVDIKRSNGHQSGIVKKFIPDTIKSKEEASVLKDEVTTLKQRIEEMNKNIDELTSMVQKVTLKQEGIADPESNVGSKRKKVENITDNQIQPDAPVSCSSAMEIEELSLDNSSFPPLPPAEVPSRSSSTTESSKLTDDDFVDQLFNQFGDDDNEMVGLLEEPRTDTPQVQPTEDGNENSPDPKLMKKLSDALALLPREMQEMIVDRLVINIVGTESIEKNVKAASALSDASKPVKSVSDGKVTPTQVPVSPSLESRPAPEQTPKVPLSLAAATLAALLGQYTAVKGKDGDLHKSLPPVIPIHA